MSLVNWSGLVCEILSRRSFLCKDFNVFINMRRWASLVTEISITMLEVFRYEHSNPVAGMKVERLRLVHLCNQAEISHMNRR